jgi:FlaG/FlaF family flagellin (archaellin)
MERDFYYVLYTTLLANCPVDTGNMVSNITLEDYGDYWKITISGPRYSSQGFFDYAKSVNYNPQRTPKEARNYQWVERVIKQVSEVIGGSVEYELS